MGRGDKKTKRGKISIGAYGKTRPRKIRAAFVKKKEPPKTETK
jgi:30S ribosomal protein S31